MYRVLTHKGTRQHYASNGRHAFTYRTARAIAASLPGAIIERV